MDESKMDELAGGGSGGVGGGGGGGGGGVGGGSDWSYLAADALAAASFTAFPFHHRDVLSAPGSASLLLNMDAAAAAMFDFQAAFPTSSSSVPPPAFHDFASSNPFDDAPPPFLAPSSLGAGQKGVGFLAPPSAGFGGGMGWDDEDEIEQSVDASSMGVSASLENAAPVATGGGGGGGGNGGGKRRRGCRPRTSWRSVGAGRSSTTASTCCALWCPRSARWIELLSLAMQLNT
uniref:Uncharacterized protein n=1 Tax=Oryza brachyantha TaxID=4533 RepID=J3L7F5_ORYBR